MRIDRILCPVDYSEFSRHAVDQALAIRHWYGGRLTVLHVVPGVEGLLTDPIPAPHSPHVATPADLVLLRQQAARFVAAESGDLSVDVKVVIGRVVDEVVREAELLPADMVVMGSHGRSGFDRLMLGSVTERVLRKASCPVLIVPRRAPDAVPAGPVPYRHVVCAIDFSPSSVKALEYAVSIAGKAGARVTAFHAVELARVFEPTVIAGPDTMSYYQSLAADARERLRRLLASHTPIDVYVEGVLGKGSPYQEILRVAAEQSADLVVLGAHGGLAGRLAFGSTVNQVVRQADCPVVTVRADRAAS
jgi:nucleotide-binding universal stress UspA family protein